MPAAPIIEGEDYYLLPDGRFVLTAHYLRRRGYCCGNGCLNCPFDYEKVKEPRRAELLALRQQNNEKPSGDAT